MSEPQTSWRSTAVRGDSPQPDSPDATQQAGEPPTNWRSTAVRESEDSPSVEQKVGAFGSQATASAVSGAAMLSGMSAGAAIGTLGGPFAPITVPAGAAIGGYAGYKFGEGAKSLAGIGAPEQMSPNLRPYGVAGEFVGGAVPFAAAPMAAAKLGVRLPPSTVGNFLNKIVDSAANSPGMFAAAEAGGAIGGGLYGGIAEGVWPGETWKRVGAEVAGGFASPFRIASTLGDAAISSGKRVIRGFSQSAQETAAGKILKDAVEAAGEDPVLLAKLLRSSGLFEGQTAAQKTGSNALAELEAKLAAGNGQFSADAQKSAQESMDTISSMLVALRGTGDPAALTAAGELQSVRFRTLLAARVNAAERDATEAASRMSLDTPGARSQLSRVASESLDGAMRDARGVEASLWGEIPKGIRAGTASIVKTMGEIRANMLVRERLPEIAEGTVMDFVENGGRTTSGELILFRSRMLTLARDAEKPSEARIYGKLAEAALDDLDRMATHPSFGAYGKIAEGYDAARRFSKEFNDVFTRTFAGKALATDARGADRIPPELMMKKALATGEEAGALRFRELEEATKFLPERSLGGPEASIHLERMLNAQERVLRLAAAESIDPLTGRVSAGKLSRVIRDNEELLDRFPEVRSNLEMALTSENRLSEVERMAKGISRVAGQRAAFAKISQYENASDAVKAAISDSNKTPLEDLTNLVKVATRGGPDAVSGLKAAMWEHSVRSATKADGEIDPAKLGIELFRPIRPGQPSMMDVMVENGIMSPEGRKQTEDLLAEVVKISNVMKANPTQADLMDLPGALADLMVTSMGAHIGSAISAAGIGGGHSLILAGRGAQAARNIFDKVPRGKVTDLLIQAAKDPQFMAMLMEKPATKEQGIQLMRTINAYLFSAGFTNYGEDQ